MQTTNSLISLAALLLLTGATSAAPIATTFTYQGRLGDAGQPANGTYDLLFALRDSAAGGTPIGGPVVMEDVAVQNGLFTVTLDFGEDAFSEGARWLEIGVRPGAAPTVTAFTLLSPRQAVTAAPLAIHALTSDTATTALNALSAGSATTATNATKAASADAVAWNHVSDLPTGFADGTDNDTTYTPGAGLTLGSGNAFAINFAGSGTLNTAARSDHSHFGAVWSGASGGTGLSLTNTSASGTGAMFRQGTGSGLLPFGGLNAGLWADAHDGPALFGSSASASAITGQTTGSAVGAAGVTGLSEASTGRGVYGHATFTGSAFGTSYGVVGECESPAGAGVKAVGANPASPALEIQNGGIKVSGAGVSSQTPVFVHEATDANLAGEIPEWETPNWYTVIDHPLCNGKPNAILIVTAIYHTSLWHGTPTVYYDTPGSRWRIAMDEDWNNSGYYRGMYSGARFNVLVVTP